MKLAILIPIKKNLADFETTLASILRWRPEHCQVIVTHDGSYQDPYDLSDEVDFYELKKSDWTRWFGDVIQLVDSEYVFSIQPGFEVSEGWFEQIEAQFKQESVVSVSPAFSADNAIVHGLVKSWNGQPALGIEGSRRPIDSVTRFVGCWKTDFVKQIVPSFAKKRGPIDLELGLIAKSLGLHTRVTDTVNVQTALTTNQLQAELTLSGYRAQQVMLRHSNAGFISRFFRTAGAVLLEPCGGPHRVLDCFGRMIACMSAGKQSEIAEQAINRYQSACANETVQQSKRVDEIDYSRAA